MTRTQSRTRWGLCLSASLALAGLAGPTGAQAQQASTCDTDEDCEHGHSCQVTSAWGSGCAAPACAPGEPCEATPCVEESGETRECVAGGPCAADADCIAGWVCVAATMTDCGDAVDAAARPAACPEGETCPDLPEPEPIDPPTCETTTANYCSPPYIQPCEEAADCGPGFNCTEASRPTCASGGTDSGGGDSGNGASPSDPADPPPDGFAPPEEETPIPQDEACAAETVSTFYCELIETPCTTDQDCADGLICQASPNDASCASPTEPMAGTAGAGGGGENPAPPADGDAFIAPSDCTEAPEPASVCAPPGFFSFSGGVAADSAGRGESQTGSDDESGEPSSDLDDSPTEPAAPQVNAGGERADADTMEDSSGCSATGHRSASGSLLVMMLAVLGLVLRRQKLRA